MLTKKHKKKRKKEVEKKETDDGCRCPECDEEYNDECDDSEVWIECESCYKWYNLNCTTQQLNDNLEEMILFANFVFKLKL